MVQRRVQKITIKTSWSSSTVSTTASRISVFRLAQIVHDSGTDSVPVLVTWPSRGSLTAYGYDRESTNYSRNASKRSSSASAKDPR